MKPQIPCVTERLRKKRQAIHCKRRELDLADSTYRSLLLRVAGVRSSTELTTLAAHDAVLSALDRLGAAPSGEWAFVFRLPGLRQALGKKIYRCAEKIGKAQTPRLRAMPKAWVEGIVRQSQGFNAAVLPRG